MDRSETLCCCIFAEPGPKNTQATLELAVERAGALGIDQLVVASSTGRTALEAAKLFSGEVIGVTLGAGHWQRYCPPDPELCQEAERQGARMLTCPHALLGGVDAAVSAAGGLAAAEIIARTYYTISQGAKVAVECTLMAADAGMLNMDRETIGIGGTNGGADTALVISPAFTNTFFDLRIREVLAKPR
ncbi:MAG: pyruvate kinase alpha/beta domain-containing protein [Armatimonadota bacterium]|nr:pyruvate kinase alpha/beta domain-containing protein [Armatimonadota bacterium]